MTRIAESTGEVDKRTVNGNNNTQRGKDKKPRKKREGYYVLKDEVVAGLTARLEIVTEYFGGKFAMAKALKIDYSIVQGWYKRGRISAEGARRIHAHYRKSGSRGYRATYCRPDLEFDGNGKPLVTVCRKREMLRVVRAEEKHD